MFTASPRILPNAAPVARKGINRPAGTGTPNVNNNKKYYTVLHKRGHFQVFSIFLFLFLFLSFSEF
jgi:hypothetical protein